MFAGFLREEMEGTESDVAIALVKRVRYNGLEVLVGVGLSGPTRFGMNEQGRATFSVAKPRMLFVRPRMDRTDDESASAFLEETVTSLKEKEFEVIRLEDPWDRAVGRV